MKVLVGCEESQAVCIAFRKRGHEAYSCDILPCSGGHPEWHKQIDVRKILHQEWDLAIFHPPCTYLCNSGVRWLYNKDKTINKDRWNKLWEALKFWNELALYPIKKIAFENPIPHKYAKQVMGEYTQIIQPWMFGHTTSKATCLWLRGLPPLQPTRIIPKEERTQDIWRMPPGPERAKERSRTFPGIAKAMAEQWG